MNPLLAPLVIGGSMLTGGAINYLGQRGANATNMELARQGQQFEQYMWQKNNKYNSPVEQMKRLKAAGLNPNMIYGSGSASTGLSSSYPKAHVATVQNELQGLGGSVASVLPMFMDMQVKQAQIDNLNNNADLTLQKTINEAIKARFMELGIEGKGYENQKIKSLLPYATPAMEANIEKLRLGNRDMLYKIENMNPEMLSNLQKRNKDLDYKLSNFNPLTAEGMKIKNRLATQALSEINPQLMQLRQVEKSLKDLELKTNTGLQPFYMDAKSNTPLKLVVKGLQDVFNLFPSWNDIKNGEPDSKGRVNKGGTW